MGSLNLQIFRAINGWPESWAPFLRFFSEAMNQSWFKLLVLILIVAMFIRNRNTRTTAILVLLALALSNPLTDLWKHLHPEPRPFQEIVGVILRAGWAPSKGTASAHASNMMSVAVVFLARMRWWGVPWLIAAILTGFSRVYVGVHYPYQVLLGWGTGIFAATVVLLVYKYAVEPRLAVRSKAEVVAPTNEP